MAYKCILLPEAEKDLDDLDTPVARRILRKLQWFAAQPNPLHYAKSLHNAEIGDIRFRVGDYRIVAVVDQKKQLIDIVAIGHRREIYR